MKMARHIAKPSATLLTARVIEKAWPLIGITKFTTASDRNAYGLTPDGIEAIRSVMISDMLVGD